MGARSFRRFPTSVLIKAKHRDARYQKRRWGWTKYLAYFYYYYSQMFCGVTLLSLPNKVYKTWQRLIVDRSTRSGSKEWCHDLAIYEQRKIHKWQGACSNWHAAWRIWQKSQKDSGQSLTRFDEFVQPSDRWASYQLNEENASKQRAFGESCSDVWSSESQATGGIRSGAIRGKKTSYRELEDFVTIVVVAGR